MLESISYLLGLACLVAACVIIGRALLVLIGAFAGKSIENFLLAGFIGTGLWMLVFGWASHAGLIASRASLCVFAIAIALLIGLIVRGRIRALMPSWGRWESLLLVGLSVVGGCAALGPILAYQSYDPFNDTFAYVTGSEWLQTHAFNEPYDLNLAEPAYRPALVYQRGQLRMGATFLLASIQSVWSTRWALELFPIVAAWGAILNGWGVYLVSRWVFRLSRGPATCGMLLTLVTVGPLHYTVHNGFYPQLFGTAILLAVVACMSRTLAPARWTFSSAMVHAILGASLFSVYSEMVPVLVVLCGAYVLLVTARAWKTQRWARLLKYVSATAVLLLALANIEIARAAHAIPHQLKVVPGGHIPWTDVEFWAFAVGAKYYPLPVSALGWLGTVLLSGLVVLGFYQAARRPSAVILAANVALLVALALYFRLAVTNPWTGGTGNTFSVFKVAKWAFPLLCVFSAAGLGLIVQRWPRTGKVFCGVLCLAGIAWAMPVNHTAAGHTATRLIAFVQSPNPLLAMRSLEVEVAARGIENVFLVHEPVGVFPRIYVPYVMRNCKFENNWHGSWLHHPDDPVQPVPISTEAALLTLQPPPFENAESRLTSGWTLIEHERPVITSVVNHNYGVQHDAAGQPFLWVGQTNATFYIFSRTAGQYELQMATYAGPALPEVMERTLEFRIGEHRHVVRTAESQQRITVPLEISQGLVAIEIRCLDEPTHPQADVCPDGLPGSLLVHCSQIQLLPREAPAEGLASPQPAVMR